MELRINGKISRQGIIALAASLSEQGGGMRVNY